MCKRSATLTDHYVKCQLAFKLWLRQLSSKATVLQWITALCDVSSVHGWMADTRQQALILQATTAVPDPRWNETSNCIHPHPPIRIKTPVTLVKWSRIPVISTALDADIQSSIRLGGKSLAKQHASTMFFSRMIHIYWEGDGGQCRGGHYVAGT